MKRLWPRGLLLAVSALCVFVLAPASALSQGSEVTAGCGTASVDGVMAAGEWSQATRVALTNSGVTPAHNVLPTSGSLYLMNDESYLYVAAAMTLEENPTASPASDVSPAVDNLHTVMCLMFTDEGNAEDDEWEAGTCDPPPAEGQFCTERWVAEGVSPGPEFKGWSKAQPCCNVWIPTEGVDARAMPGSNVTLVWEWKVDLSTSELDKVTPPGCFRLGAWAIIDGDSQLGLVEGQAKWPSGLAAPLSGVLLPADWEEWPDTFGTLCLNPCGAGFVPEPGTIVLLGSGLMGLAGYAALRWKNGR